MIKAALDLFMLRKHAWVQFEYPLWHSIVAITLIGLLYAFDPAFREVPDVSMKYGVGGVVVLQLPAMVAMVGAAYLAGALLGMLWALGILPTSPLA